jgi:cysteine desulfurase/selenocysteine lyase
VKSAASELSALRGAAPSAASSASSSASFDVARLREDFPILRRTVNGKPLIYLDNAATSQKPQSVIDCEGRYYAELNANIHRGVHSLSQQATGYEAARYSARFINGAARGNRVRAHTTRAINLVAAELRAALAAEV